MKRQWSFALSVQQQYKKSQHPKITCVLAEESEETTEHHWKVSGDRNSPNCSKLQARLGWNVFLTSLFLLYKEDMKDHRPQWANSVVHRGGVNIGMEVNYGFATEEICNSKIEGNAFPSFREMTTGIKYTSANPCHKELVCYQTNQTSIHLFCMTGNKFIIFTFNFL